ncbi:MAG: hypothetical protein ACLFWF_12470 [Alphaproteobacteria bacterium]
MNAPDKYQHIDFTPPQEVAERAAHGLELRERFNRGGTEVGVERAQQLKRRETLSPDIIKKMYSYFARHQVDKDTENFGDEDNPSAGYVAWLLWGGDEGKAWVDTIREQMREADRAA